MGGGVGCSTPLCVGNENLDEYVKRKTAEGVSDRDYTQELVVFLNDYTYLQQNWDQDDLPNGLDECPGLYSEREDGCPTEEELERLTRSESLGGIFLDIGDAILEMIDGADPDIDALLDALIVNGAQCLGKVATNEVAPICLTLSGSGPAGLQCWVGLIGSEQACWNMGKNVADADLPEPS